MRKAILILTLACFGYTAYAQPPQDGATLIQPAEDDGLEIQGGVDDRFESNLKFVSVLLARRQFQPASIRKKGLYIGSDLSVVKVPTGIESSTLSEVAQKFLAIPLPIISIDYSSNDWQDNYSFFYGSTSPIPDTKMSYFTLRLGRDFFIDTKKKWVGGIKLLYTSFRGDREVELLGTEVSQGFGLVGSGGEMTFSYEMGGGFGSFRRNDSIRFLPQFSFGSMSITSEFRSDDLDTFVRFKRSVPYLGAGFSLCGTTKETCMLVNAYYDLVSGLMPNATFITKI